MKKYFVIALLTMAVAVSGGDAYAANSVKFENDTLTVIDSGDTMKVAGASAVLSKIKSELKKPAFGDGATIEYNDDDEDNVEVASDTSSDELYYKNQREDRNYEFRMVGMVMTIICSTIIALVFISLIFFFLHRRRKYVMIEKAIENNYQLPSSVTGMYAQDIPQQNEPFDGQAMPQNGAFDGQQETASPYASQYVPRPPFVGNPNAQGMTQKNVPGQYNLSNFKSSVCWLVIGVIGIFFGLCTRTEFFIFMFMIPFVIGLVKAINEFLGQRSRVEYEKWQMQQRYYANYAQSEPKSGTSGQQNDEGVTPPPFDGGEMK